MSEVAGRHRIGAVARLTGISEHALRVWERRYKTVTPSRPAGGQRLYSDADIERLRRLKHLADLGHSIGTVARLPDTELESLLQREAKAEAFRPKPPVAEGPRVVGADSAFVDGIRERFMEAITTFDMDAASRVISRALAAFEPLELIMQVVVPLLQEVGDRWQDSKLSIAQEHAATAMLRGQLGGVIRMLPPHPAASLAVCATPSGEQHEFGALFAAMVCAARGWRVLYLGSSLPVDEIANAARLVQARAVMLSIVVLPPVEAARAVSRLRTLLPRSVELYLGGRGVDPKAKFVGAHHLHDLQALVAVLDATPMA